MKKKRLVRHCDVCGRPTKRRDFLCVLCAEDAQYDLNEDDDIYRIQRGERAIRVWGENNLLEDDQF